MSSRNPTTARPAITAGSNNPTRQARVAAFASELRDAEKPLILSDDGVVRRKAVDLHASRAAAAPPARPTAKTTTAPPTQRRPSNPPPPATPALTSTPISAALIAKLSNPLRPADRTRLEIEAGVVDATELARRCNIAVTQIASLIKNSIIPTTCCRCGKGRFYWNLLDLPAIQESVARHRGRR